MNRLFFITSLILNENNIQEPDREEERRAAAKVLKISKKAGKLAKLPKIIRLPAAILASIGSYAYVHKRKKNQTLNQQ